MPSDITVVITTVAPRREMLRTCLRSVAGSTLPPDEIIISEDTTHAGAAATRQAGTDRVRTKLVAYVDDDDEIYPQHLEHLRDLLVREDADLVFPWFDCTGRDPFPECFGRNWADYLVDHPAGYQIPVTFLAKVDTIRAAGGWLPHPEMAHVSGEDWRLTQELIAQRAKIVHLAERTWKWVHWGGNSSGLPGRIPW